MKIGIITQPLKYNYGGLLQNYALQQVLMRLGHSPETIDWRPRKSNPIINLIWETKKWLLWRSGITSERLRYKLTKEEASVIMQHTDYFIKKYIVNCPDCATSKEEFHNIAKKYRYDGYIVGSDQVWRPCYAGGFMDEMFLSFVESTKNIRRMAYAASFGVSKWEFTPEQTKRYAALAQKFNLVTVREDSAVRLCNDFLGVDAIHVLDPTMLLSKQDYEKLVIVENEKKHKGTLFQYILDPSDYKNSLIKELCLKEGLESFTVLPKYQAENRKKKDVKEHLQECVYPSVTSWLQAFVDAKMVLVDSFHGAVFSIIFNKPFWVVDNGHRGNARFESLLGMFHLEDRLITPDKINEIKWDKPINWSIVNKLLEKERERCQKLLSDSVQ